jgi:hypothetical protein
MQYLLVAVKLVEPQQQKLGLYSSQVVKLVELQHLMLHDQLPKDLLDLGLVLRLFLDLKVAQLLEQRKQH